MSFRDQISSRRAAARGQAEELAASAAGRGESLFEKLKAAVSRKSEQAEKPAKPAKPSKPIPSKKAKLARKARGGRTPIAAHKSFVPLIAGWGSALAGLTIVIVPDAALRSIVELAQLSALGGYARIALALLAALFGGLIAYAAARAIAKTVITNAAQSVEDKFVEDELRVIDPSSELGSDSLDAPIESVDEISSVAEEEQPEETDEPQKEALQTAIFGSLGNGLDPRMPANILTEPLELADVAEVVEEDDVTEEAVSEPEPEPEPASPPAPPIPADAPDFLRGSAVESLRNMSTDNMSLIQMVERFATALHAHQAAVGENGQPRRDAALAEALRALSLFTQSKEEAEAITQKEAASLTPGGFTGRAQETERELRDALEKLQKLSGAA